MLENAAFAVDVPHDDRVAAGGHEPVRVPRKRQGALNVRLIECRCGSRVVELADFFQIVDCVNVNPDLLAKADCQQTAVSGKGHVDHDARIDFLFMNPAELVDAAQGKPFVVKRGKVLAVRVQCKSSSGRELWFRHRRLARDRKQKPLGIGCVHQHGGRVVGLLDEMKF